MILVSCRFMVQAALNIAYTCAALHVPSRTIHHSTATGMSTEHLAAQFQAKVQVSVRTLVCFTL